MARVSNRVIVVGAGPVGLCLSLALAQAGVQVCLIETLGEDNFLEQVPRAGTNHPATLELFERIGLYHRLEPRGIVAPLFHYWDRHENKLIAEFDHAHLKDDTRFPYVLQCERIKIVEEALQAGESASRDRAAPVHDLHRLHARRRRRDGAYHQSRRRDRKRSRRLSRQRRRRAQHRPQGARYRVRGLHLSRPHPQHRGRLRFQAARLYRAQLHLRSRGVVEPVSLEGSARPLARPFPDRARGGRGGAHASGRAAGAAAAISAHRQGVRHRRQQSLRRAPARGAEIPRRPRDPRRRLPRT